MLWLRNVDVDLRLQPWNPHKLLANQSPPTISGLVEELITRSLESIGNDGIFSSTLLRDELMWRSGCVKFGALYVNIVSIEGNMSCQQFDIFKYHMNCQVSLPFFALLYSLISTQSVLFTTRKEMYHINLNEIILPLDQIASPFTPHFHCWTTCLALSLSIADMSWKVDWQTHKTRSNKKVIFSDITFPDTRLDC